MRKLIDADEFYRILENKATMDEICLLSHTFSLKELAHILHTQPKIEAERPKGKWIIDECEAGKVWHSHCSECNKDPLRFVAGTEDWWVYKEDLPNYCPHCGAKMEVDE